MTEYFEAVCRDVAKRLDGLVGTVCLSNVGSTNDLAKQSATDTDRDGSSATLFLAREQSAGRGRMGRSFLCRRDRGIYMSLLYFTDEKLPDVVSVTTFAALAVAEAIERATGRDMRIKWVNDVYDERGKVSGILVETVGGKDKTGVVVGIGINVGESDFPEELSQIASSVGELDASGSARLISDIVIALLEHSHAHSDRSFMDGYRARFMLSGEHVEIESDGEIIARGTVEGVDDGGGLLLVPDGESTTVCICTGSVKMKK